MTPHRIVSRLASSAQDNCFFGVPSVIDRVLAQYERNYSTVYTTAAQLRLPRESPELQLIAAAKLAGVPLADPCSAPSMAYLAHQRAAVAQRKYE